MAKLLVLLALLFLAHGCRAQRTTCPPANGLRDSVCGNVDGRDGPERVGIEIRHGPSIWLVVRFADHTVARKVQGDEGMTFVNGLAALDRRPGLEIVVTVHEGASTAFGQVFRIENDALRRIAIPGFGGDFPYEGSVGHFNVIDCARPRSGLIWISGYWLAGSSHYIQERVRYRIADDRLVGVARKRSRETLQTAGRFPEFAEPQPFPHCLVVRGERTR